MLVKFHNIGKIPGGFVAAYGAATLKDGTTVQSANVTFIEAADQAGNLLQYEPDTVYRVQLVKVPAAELEKAKAELARAEAAKTAAEKS